MILDPVTVRADQRVRDVLVLMNKYKISGIPVVDDANAKLIGIITNRDLRFEPDEDQLVSDDHDEGEPCHRARGHDARAGEAHTARSTRSRNSRWWTSTGC